MATTHCSLVTSILLYLMILSTFTFTSAKVINWPVYTNFLSPRQQDANATCAEYSTIANLSVVGSNSTYRAAYLAASPQGADPARAPLDTAEGELPKLQFDTALNAECGNLTQVAIAGAAANFTNGVVLQFKINAAPQIGAKASRMALIGIVVVVMVMDVL